MRPMHTRGLLAAAVLLVAPLSPVAQAPVSDPTQLEARISQLERSASAGGSVVQMHQTLQRIEREVRELRRANEILRKASAFFAQAELDRKQK